MAFSDDRDLDRTHGYEPTREAAMAALAKSWRGGEKGVRHAGLAAGFRTIQVCPKDLPATLGEDRRRNLIDGIAFGGGFPWL
jgi:hypothetical protein